jgi:hypothetical protein
MCLLNVFFIESFSKTTRSQFKPFRIVAASQCQSIDVFVVATSKSLCWSLLLTYLSLQHSFRVLKICSPQFYWFQFFKISRKTWRFTTHPLLAPLSVVYPVRVTFIVIVIVVAQNFKILFVSATWLSVNGTSD